MSAPGIEDSLKKIPKEIIETVKKARVFLEKAEPMAEIDNPHKVAVGVYVTNTEGFVLLVLPETTNWTAIPPESAINIALGIIQKAVGACKTRDEAEKLATLVQAAADSISTPTTKH